MPDLIQKLAEIASAVGYVQKDASNDHHGYRYASAEAVLRKVNAECSKRGVAVSTASELLRYEEFTAGGKPKMRAVVKLTVTFTDGSQSLKAEGLGEGADSGDKAVLKANTSALKYALAGAFLISWGDDPEADSSTDADAAEPRRPQRPAARAKAVASPEEALAEEIKAAKSMAELEPLKERVKALVGTPAYLPLQSLWRGKASEIRKG